MWFYLEYSYFYWLSVNMSLRNFWKCNVLWIYLFGQGFPNETKGTINLNINIRKSYGVCLSDFKPEFCFRFSVAQTNETAFGLNMKNVIYNMAFCIVDYVLFLFLLMTPVKRRFVHGSVGKLTIRKTVFRKIVLIHLNTSLSHKNANCMSFTNFDLVKIKL